MRTSYQFEQYAKAFLVFAATTATYFFARATGILPSWFNGGKNRNHHRCCCFRANHFTHLMEAPVHSVAFEAANIRSFIRDGDYNSNRRFLSLNQFPIK